MDLQKKRSLLLGCIVSVTFSSCYLLTNPYVFTSAKDLYSLGLTTYQRGAHLDLVDHTELEQAARYFNVAIAKGYQEREVFLNTYWCYLHAYDSLRDARMEEILTKGLRVYPTDTEFLFRRGDSRLQQHKFTLALQDYNQALQDEADFDYKSNVLYSRGAAKYMLGKREEAEKDRASAQKMNSRLDRSYAEYCTQFKWASVRKCPISVCYVNQVSV